jgi:hypothetical protein
MAVYQIVILRFTPKQIRTQPTEVIRDIREALEGARGRPPLNLRTVLVSATRNAVTATRL